MKFKWLFKYFRCVAGYGYVTYAQVIQLKKSDIKNTGKKKETNCYCIYQQDVISSSVSCIHLYKV